MNLVFHLNKKKYLPTEQLSFNLIVFDLNETLNHSLTLLLLPETSVKQISPFCQCASPPHSVQPYILISL